MLKIKPCGHLLNFLFVKLKTTRSPVIDPLLTLYVMRGGDKSSGLVAEVCTLPCLQNMLTKKEMKGNI